MKFLIWIYTNTIAKMNWPYSHKHFKLQDYFKIEKELDKLEVPFAIGMNTVYGSGSNLGIKLSNLLSKDKRKRKSGKTHLFIYINKRDGRKFRVAEQVGEGLQEISLLQAIGQKDEVTIRIPNKDLLDDELIKVALEYVHNVLDKDKINNIAYDNNHSLNMDDSSDCSGLLWQALTYAFEKLDRENLLHVFERAGMSTFTPVDAEFSVLFNTIYDSNIN